jgi:hypothetical protein
MDRKDRAGIVYVNQWGGVDRELPLPIEVVDAPGAPEATLDAINAEADREARLAARRFEREGEALAAHIRRARVPGPCPCACNTLDQPCGGCGHAGCGRR